jgi:hypothetical protein
MTKIRIEADKIGGLFVSQEGKNYVAIPFDDRFMDLFKRKDGTTGITINVATWDKKEIVYDQNGFANTGFVKPDYKADAYKALSEDDRKLIPIIGNVTEFKGFAPDPQKWNPKQTNTPATEPEDLNGDKGDMPF